MQRLFTPASLAGSMGAQGFALLAGRSMGFVRGVVLAWLLSQREFGMFQVAVAVVNLLVPMSNLGLSHGTLRYAPAHEAGGTLLAFARRASVLVLSVSLVICGLVLLLPAGVTRFIFAAGAHVDAATGVDSTAGGTTSGLVAAAAVCAFSLVVFHLPVDLMKGLRLFRASGATEVTGVLFFSILAVSAPLAGFDSANAVLLAYGGGNILSAAIFTPPLIRYLRAQKPDHDAVRALPLIDTAYARYSLWIAASLVSWHGLQQYVLWHLARVGGNALAGTYFAVRLFAQLIYLCGQAAARALASNVTRVWEVEGRQPAIDRLEAGQKLGVLAVFAAATVVSLIKPWILLAFPRTFAAGSSCFDALVLAYAWFAALEFLIIRFHLEEKAVPTFLISSLGAVANVALAFALLGAPWSASSLAPTDVLIRAGWVCAAGSGAAVTVCLTILYATGRGPRGTTVIPIIAIGSLGAGGVAALGVGVVLLASALAGNGLFTPAERAIIANWRAGR